MASSMKELRALTDDELIKQHDRLAANTAIGVNYYLNELRARQQSKINEEMRSLTKRIYWLTVIVTFATIINLAPVALTLASVLER